MKNALKVSLMLIPVLFLSGCLAVVAGGAAGAVAYVKGELTSAVEYSIDDTNQAVVQMADNLELIVFHERTDALSGSFEYENSQDKKIVIKTNKVSSNVSEIVVRVGVFGDESLSFKILDEIKAELAN